MKPFLRLIRIALLGSLAWGVNPAAADVAAAEAAREGKLERLIFQEPSYLGYTAFETFQGTSADLSQYHGKHVVLNFWATWCAPCRKEMPGLDRLNAAFGGDDFAVVTIATGKNNPMAMERFFQQAGIETLPLHKDPLFELADAMGVRGLPFTVILDPQGRVLARLQGDAEWDSPSAKAIVSALTGLGS